MSKAIIVATGVAADGNREVLGLAVGDSEHKAFWTAFLRSLRARGLAACASSSPTPTRGFVSRSSG